MTRKVLAVVAVVLVAAMAGGAAYGVASGRNYDIRAGDRVFVNDAGLICTDQRLTARELRPLTRTLGQFNLLCFAQNGSLLRSYEVRVSDLGVVVEKGNRVVYRQRNP